MRGGFSGSVRALSHEMIVVLIVQRTKLDAAVPPVSGFSLSSGGVLAPASVTGVLGERPCRSFRLEFRGWLRSICDVRVIRRVRPGRKFVGYHWPSRRAGCAAAALCCFMVLS
jgi:hypothetical protein